jgi:hypothetical protein
MESHDIDKVISLSWYGQGGLRNSLDVLPRFSTVVRTEQQHMRLPLDNRGKECYYLGLCISLPLVVCGLFTYTAGISYRVEWYDDWGE